MTLLDPILPLLNITETARLLNIHVETLRRWDKTGIFPAIKKGSRKDRYYKYGDVVYKYAQMYLKNGAIPLPII